MTAAVQSPLPALALRRESVSVRGNALIVWRMIYQAPISGLRDTPHRHVHASFCSSAIFISSIGVRAPSFFFMIEQELAIVL